MRELRHDFRRIYHVCYDEVEAGEAVDLALTLPPGSAYLAALDPHWAWTVDQSLAADVYDRVSQMVRLYATHTTEGAALHPRPGDEADRAADRERAREVRQIIEGTVWEEA